MIPFQINQITYEGLVSNPVWSWFGACMLVLSFWNLAVKGSKFITLVENHWLRVSVSFYALLLVLGESLFSISALAFHQTILLKVLGSLFIFNGVYIGSIKIIQFQRAGYKKIFSKDSIQNLMLLALFLIAIAPVTDADSISYHLATPLQILRNGSNQGIGEYWLHARLLGYGEYINLLGIANGIDCLGAVIQWTGLLLFVLTIRTYFKGPGKELFLYALLSMPCILFLVSTQKPQLSGDLAILTGVIAFLSLQSQRHDYKYLMVLGLPLFYSLTLKYTFYLPVIVLIIVFIATSIMQKTGHSLVKLFIVLAGFYLAFLSPIHLFNYFNYRDPVSPFLSGSSTGLTNFIHYLTGDPGFNIAYIWVPPSLGIYTTTIGLAGILFLFGDFKSVYRVAFFAMGCFLLIIDLLLKMEAARFMMTAFLLMNLSLLFSTKLYAFPFIKMVLITQLTINFILICSLLYSTLPANFFKSYRIKCLQDKAYTFSLYRWMDTLSLPAESVVVPSLRAHLFINQNYVPYETRYFDSSPILSGKSTYYLFDTLSSTAGILIDSTSYKLATRNIFNQRTSKAFLYKVAD